MTRIAIYGGSFDPPGIHHRRLAQWVAELIGNIVVVPCGPRPDKPGAVSPEHRSVMTLLNFADLLGVRIDTADLNARTFTPTWQLCERYREHEVWHVVGADLVAGSAASEIQRCWARGPWLWEHGRFLVLTRPGETVTEMPPQSELVEVNVTGSSTAIREKLARDQDISSLVLPAVKTYIEDHGLYRGENR